MGGILDKLDEWLRGLLIEGITGNLSGIFDTVNTKVGEIAGEVGKTPQGWNSGVFSMIRSLSETVIVPIAGVILENFDLSHLPVYLMDEEQLSLYATYMSTLGNRPDLFGTAEYPNASTLQEPTYYDIPPEALEDETFAAMIAEAEKYLGYPYVWGGSSPSTSFDCSGFVSWVINHSGWNVGRLGAQGLYSICTPVSSSQAKPGDLIFFVGTYDTAGVSHVGIYVGGGMMIHCGSSISYTSINTSYWQAHYFSFGRLP